MYILLNITITHFSEGVKAFDSDLNSAAWRAVSFCHRFCQWKEMILSLLKGRSTVLKPANFLDPLVFDINSDYLKCMSNSLENLSQRR